MSRVSVISDAVLKCAFVGLLLFTSAQADEPNSRPEDSAASPAQQIVVRTRLVEINLRKLRHLGLDFSFLNDDGKVVVQGIDGQTLNADGFVGPDGKGSPFPESVASPSMNGFLDALLQNKLARVLADPTIAVLDGRPASFSVGGTIEIAGPPGSGIGKESRFVGTKLDVVPEIVENNRVRIDYHLKLSELAEPEVVEQAGAPALLCREIDTSFEVDLGETFTLAGLSGNVRVGDKTEERELVLLVTPELAGEAEKKGKPDVRVSQAISEDKATR